LGVDVLVQESVILQLVNIDREPEQQAHLHTANSLVALPDLIRQCLKFDIILLDGDHNYHTVIQELKFIEELIHDHGMIVIDDYDGKWANRDLWYAEREGYQNVPCVTPRVETLKHGVKLAVDDWLARHPEWKIHKPIPGEPILLMRDI
jgi:hypothetical protein